VNWRKFFREKAWLGGTILVFVLLLSGEFANSDSWFAGKRPYAFMVGGGEADVYSNWFLLIGSDWRIKGKNVATPDDGTFVYMLKKYVYIIKRIGYNGKILPIAFKKGNFLMMGLELDGYYIVFLPIVGMQSEPYLTPYQLMNMREK